MIFQLMEKNLQIQVNQIFEIYIIQCDITWLALYIGHIPITADKCSKVINLILFLSHKKKNNILLYPRRKYISFISLLNVNIMFTEVCNFGWTCMGV